MKITHIKKLCKEAHECRIYNAQGRQWIGTQTAIYPVDDMHIRKESIKTLFDMPDAEAELEITEQPIFHSILIPDEGGQIDFAMGGWQKLDPGETIYHLGEPVKPFVHEGGILFVLEERIKPALRKNDYTDYRLAHNRFGDPIILIGNGMLTTGIVWPLPKSTAEKILEQMDRLTRFVPDGSPAKDEAKRREEEEPGQIGMEEMLKEEQNETD